MRVREQRWGLERSGGVKRECAVELPVGHIGACALLVHAFPHEETAARLGRALARRGIATLRLDVASGEAPFGVDDLLAAAALMREKVGAPRLLVGHSLGGAAVLAAAHLLPEVSAVATVAATVPNSSGGPAKMLAISGTPCGCSRPFAAANSSTSAAAPGFASPMALINPCPQSRQEGLTCPARGDGPQLFAVTAPQPANAARSNRLTVVPQMPLASTNGVGSVNSRKRVVRSVIGDNPLGQDSGLQTKKMTNDE